MSATAVLAKPRRRNSASAVSMIRARVSSGLVLTCGFIGWGAFLFVNSDEISNSSEAACQALRRNVITTSFAARIGTGNLRKQPASAPAIILSHRRLRSQVSRLKIGLVAGLFGPLRNAVRNSRL